MCECVSQVLLTSKQTKLLKMKALVHLFLIKLNTWSFYPFLFLKFIAEEEGRYSLVSLQLCTPKLSFLQEILLISSTHESSLISPLTSQCVSQKMTTSPFRLCSRCMFRTSDCCLEQRYRPVHLDSSGELAHVSTCKLWCVVFILRSLWKSSGWLTGLFHILVTLSMLSPAYLFKFVLSMYKM